MYTLCSAPDSLAPRPRGLHRFLFAAACIVVAADGTQAQRTTHLTLRDLLTDALQHHPSVRAADARVLAALGARRTAGALANPVLSYEVENAALPGRSSPSMDREAMTTATLPLQSLVQRWPRVQRARAEVEAAQAEAVAQRQALGLSAVHAFYRTALAQIGLDNSRDLVSWLDSIVTYNRVRVTEGVAAEADLIRSQLERDHALADEAMQAAELARAIALLRTFQSESTSGPLAFDTVPLRIEASAIDSTGEIAARPDVRAARDRLRAATAATTLQRTMLVPEIGGTIGIKRSAGTTSLIFGASIPVPLFDQNRGEIARASAERDAAAFELAAVERMAAAEVNAARQAASVLTERASILSTGFLERAEQARQITLGAYREGAIPLLQVIDAARAWSDARRAYYETLFAQHKSVLELLVARGIDLSNGLQLPNR